MDAIDGKKWVNSPTFNLWLKHNERYSWRVTIENAQPFETVQFQAWKITPISRSLKKKKEEKKERKKMKKTKNKTRNSFESP